MLSMKISILFLSVIVTALFVSGCGSSNQVPKEHAVQILRSESKSIQSDTVSENYVIRQGDSIQVNVWGFAQFSTFNVVKPSGMMTMPLMGEIAAEGLTKEQFVSALEKRLSEYIQGEIKLIVTIVSKSTKKVSVFGAVTRQENYPLTSDLTLVEVLAMAGGTTPEADLRHIRILRSGPDRPPIEVDLMSFVENGNIDNVPIIRAGDTVFVPKEEDVIKQLSLYMGSAVLLFSFFVLFK
jgi:polysaccharide export outer membrane protein